LIAAFYRDNLADKGKKNRLNEQRLREIFNSWRYQKIITVIFDIRRYNQGKENSTEFRQEIVSGCRMVYS